eukprot:3794860-Lingulodinium_polyedra.AAC.1
MGIRRGYRYAGPAGLLGRGPGGVTVTGSDGDVCPGDRDGCPLGLPGGAFLSRFRLQFTRRRRCRLLFRCCGRGQRTTSMPNTW